MIHAAATAALAAGATVPAVLDLAASLAPLAPVVVMAYINTLLAPGSSASSSASRRAASAG